MNRGNMQVNKLHKKTAGLVKAGTQAAMARLLEEELTGDELAVFKRGRNAKSMTTAKNASVIDYRMATGLEALTGYLYLTGQYERLLGLIGSGLEKIGELKTE
jgi:ribonuclease-3 family protein